MENREQIRTAEAADILGVHPNTIRRWAEEGLLEYTQFPSGHRRFPLDGVLKFKKHAERNPVVDLRDPDQVETMRQFIIGNITAEDAGPGFSRSPDGTPRITVAHETFSILNGETKQ